MIKYNVILFDADNTLLDFKKAEDNAFKSTLKSYDIPFNKEMKEKYSEINDSLWKKFELNEIKKDDVQNLRFTLLFKEFSLNYCGIKANKRFLEFLSKESSLINNADEVCEHLCKKHSLYIVTNGISKVQHERFNNSLLSSYFQNVFVSEDIGYKKPQKEFFNYVFENIIKTDKSNILLVGDSLTADIKGANNVKIASCWFNPDNNKNKTDIIPTYEINSLLQLVDLVE